MKTYIPPALPPFYYFLPKKKQAWEIELFGKRTQKKIRKEKITKFLGFTLALIAGFSCGLIAAVSLATVFPLLASYYWLLAIVTLSGIILEGSIYAHHLSTIFTDITFQGFFRSIEKHLVVKRMLNDKKVRRILLAHYLRLTMGRIKLKQDNQKPTINKVELYYLLNNCQKLSESQLTALLMHFVQAGEAGDVPVDSPTFQAVHKIRRIYQRNLELSSVQKEIKQKKIAWLFSTFFAIVAGIGLGSIMYTDALQALTGVVFLTGAGPYLAISIALLMGVSYTFFMMYALREVILNDLLSHFWTSLKKVLHPKFSHGWRHTTSWFTKIKDWLLHIVRCLLIITPFLILCATAILVSISMGKLFIESSSEAFTNLALFFSTHLDSHVGKIAYWMAYQEIFAGRNIIQLVSETAITLFFIPSDIIINIIYGFESIKGFLASLNKLIKGEYNLWGQLNEKLAYYTVDKSLCFKTGTKAILWMVLVALMVVHLGGEASVAGLGAEEMMGGNKTDPSTINLRAIRIGQVTAYIDLVLEIFTHLPFLVGGENEDHDHGAGVIDGTFSFFHRLKVFIKGKKHDLPSPPRISHNTRQFMEWVNLALEEQSVNSSSVAPAYTKICEQTYPHRRENAFTSPFDNYTVDKEYPILEEHIIGILTEKFASQEGHIKPHCC